MKFKKALLGLAAISMLASGLTVSAEGTNGHTHDHLNLYDKILRVREKTGEHEVYMGDGRYAVCYIYKETYECIYYCNSCGNYVSLTEIDDDVHSICQ